MYNVFKDVYVVSFGFHREICPILVSVNKCYCVDGVKPAYQRVDDFPIFNIEVLD